MGMMRQALLWCSENGWMRRTMPRLWFVHRAVRRFMPGETLAAALAETAVLNSRSVGAILTQLGESLSDPGAARRVVDHYLEVLGEISRRGMDAVISVKLTQLGLDFDAAVAREHLTTLVRAAAECGTAVWVDMEQSPLVSPTLEIVHRVRDDHDNIGVCLQAYLYRSADDLAPLLERRIGVRLVKGAYAEPPRVAYPAKRDVDENFLTLAGRVLQAPAPAGPLQPAFGTHDLSLIERLRARARELGVAPGGYQFQMLYGIRGRDLERLAAEGERVMSLISYGAAWYPWYLRRLAERPANVWFVVRSMVR